MDFKEYQRESRKTAKYPDVGNTFVYPALGLSGESGEIADKFKKLIRDHEINRPSEMTAEQKEEMAKELGDVQWYIAQLCTELGLDLEEVALRNLEKLFSRMDRDKLGGSGDNR